MLIFWAELVIPVGQFFCSRDTKVSLAHSTAGSNPIQSFVANKNISQEFQAPCGGGSSPRFRMQTSLNIFHLSVFQSTDEREGGVPIRLEANPLISCQDAPHFEITLSLMWPLSAANSDFHHHLFLKPNTPALM